MTDRTLANCYRLHAANFHDDARGQTWKKRLGDDLRGALDVLVTSAVEDVGLHPQDLDRQHVVQLLGEALPSRVGGKESWANTVPDLLEDWLMFIAEEEGVATQWEWTSAVGDGRSTYEQGIADPSRPMRVTKTSPDRRPAAKIGRNDPCPCGSGQKYKRCCLRLA